MKSEARMRRVGLVAENIGCFGRGFWILIKKLIT
jgi:hypothetical protein